KKSYKDQTDFRRTTHWVYYTMGALALLALVSSGKVGNLANYAVLLGGIATLIFSTWLHMTEAEIFHPNIRVTPVRTVPARYPQQQPPQAPPRTTPPTSVPSAPPPSAPSGVSLDRPPKEAQLPPPRSATRNSQAYVP
ncbi:MAG: hypothetical protein ACAI34_12115, partial [Verrucomicrobium sp.]|nr:hypothetical protein [Verrucomicrobium sp.]